MAESGIRHQTHDLGYVGSNPTPAILSLMFENSKKELHTCSCGSLMAVPKGHSMLEDDDKEVVCNDCDKPLGLKLYEAFAR